jgi:membrane protease YdiL (CAAX protease family)
MNTIINLFWNKEEARLRAGWRIVVFWVAWFILLFAVLGRTNALFSGRLNEVYLTLLTTAIHLLIVWFVLLGLVGSRLLDRRPLTDYGFHIGRRWWLDLGFGLILATLLILGIFVIELVMGWIKVTDTFAAVDPSLSFGPAILAGFIGLLLGVIQEEVTWRGYTIKNIAEGMNWKAIGPRVATIIAMLVSSVMFGLAHAGNLNATIFSTINTILAALLVLATGYALTGQLAMPIGFHAAWNFAQVCVFGFPGGEPILGATFIAIEQSGPEAWTGGEYGPEGGSLGTGAMILGSLLMLAWVLVKRGSIRLHPALAEPPVWFLSEVSLRRNMKIKKI